MRNICLMLCAIWPLLSPQVLIAADNNKVAAPKVAITNLLSHMKEYAGKRVEVTGYYRIGFEMSALYQNQEDAASFRDSKALWIDVFVNGGHEKNVTPVDKRVVRVIGIFEYNRRQPDLGVGYLNRWPAEIVQVELLQEAK